MRINNNIVYNQCPLCTSGDIYKIGLLRYSGMVHFSTHKITLDLSPEFWRCRHCQSCFIQNAVPENIAKTLYLTGQAGNRWSDVAFDRKMASNVLDSMSSIFNNKKNILDVGCNTGTLLDFAKGFGCKTSGVELSSTSCQILVEKGHTTYSTFEETKGGYDVITAFDLVEHLYDFPAFLKKCYEKMLNKGNLVILTGNVDSLSARLSAARWWYAQYPEHLIFPSKKYFLKHSGFHIRKWIPTYASKRYKYNFAKVLIGIIKSFNEGGYTGLPSIGPDHTMMVLEK